MDQNIETLVNFSILYSIAKLAFGILLLIYIVVAAMVIKQIKLMTRTIKSPRDKYLFVIAYLHLIVVIITFLLTITVL